MSALDDQQARYLLGPDFDEVVTKLGALLSKTKLPIALGQDAKIGDRITTVFSGDGTYLLGNVSKECNYADYPKMVRESMLSVLRELKTRNNWRPGDTVRVIFHAHRPLKRVDVIIHSSSWTVLKRVNPSSVIAT